MKIAIATQGFKGLSNRVAKHFAMAKTFTVAEINGRKVHLEIIKNPALSFQRGRGRAIVKKLKKAKIEKVVADEIGDGASALLKFENIKIAKIRSGTLVNEIIRERLYEKYREIKNLL